MRFLLLLPLLFFVGCGSPERSPELVLPAFWSEVSQWMETGSGAEGACHFLDQGVLDSYRETSDPCQAALEASFASPSITKVEPLGRSKLSLSGSVWIQPVLLHSPEGTVRRESAAALLPENNWAIQSLDGLRLASLEQEESYAAETLAELALLRSR